MKTEKGKYPSMSTGKYLWFLCLLQLCGIFPLRAANYYWGGNVSVYANNKQNWWVWTGDNWANPASPPDDNDAVNFTNLAQNRCEWNIADSAVKSVNVSSNYSRRFDLTASSMTVLETLSHSSG
ncbi:MAG TPA: hypothetical protein VJC03_04260, partial [bacterium]|nr:hypothetical protein [bacterium]